VVVQPLADDLAGALAQLERLAPTLASL